MRGFTIDRTGVVILVALFSVVLGSKLLLIVHYGSPVPYWDQWAAEAKDLYVPFFNKTLTASSWFASYAEHRILFTRVLAIGLLQLAGEWDPVLQMMANAILHTFAVVLLTALLFQAIAESERLALAILSAVVFSLPIGWENLLGGFQSQFYFLLIFSIAALALATHSRAFSAGWFLCLVAASAAYFSLASGLFAFVAAGIVVTLQILFGERRGAREWASVAVFASATLVGFLFLNRVSGYDGLKAHTIGEFLSGLVTLAGFPFSLLLYHSKSGWKAAAEFSLALIAAAPAIGLALSAPHDRSLRNNAWFGIALAVFLAMQMAALAYGRNVFVLSSRYLDIFLLLVPLNFVFLSLIRTPVALRRAWILGAIGSLLAYCYLYSFPEVAQKSLQSEAQLRNVRAFVQTADPSALEGKPTMDVPFPVPRELAEILARPEVRAILPSPLRPDDEAVRRFRSVNLPNSAVYSATQRIKEVLSGSAAVIFACGIGLFFILMWPRRVDRAIANRQRSPKQDQ